MQKALFPFDCLLSNLRKIIKDSVVISDLWPYLDHIWFGALNIKSENPWSKALKKVYCPQYTSDVKQLPISRLWVKGQRVDLCTILFVAQPKMWHSTSAAHRSSLNSKITCRPHGLWVQHVLNNTFPAHLYFWHKMHIVSLTLSVKWHPVRGFFFPSVPESPRVFYHWMCGNRKMEECLEDT